MRHIDFPKHFSRMISNQEVKNAILAARHLDLDAFTVAYERIMYAHVDHFVDGMTLDNCRAAAIECWQYLQDLWQIRTECMSLLEEGMDNCASPPPTIYGRFVSTRLPAENDFSSARSELPINELGILESELVAQNKELRRDQYASELSLARYVDIFNLAPVGYLILSDAGLIRESNLMATALLNALQDKVIGQPLTAFILSEDQDIFYHCRRQLWVAGERQSCELRVQREDGQPRWIHLVTSLAPPNENGAPRWQIVLNDIAEYKRCAGGWGQQQEQPSLTARLEQADTALFKARHEKRDKIALAPDQRIGLPLMTNKGG